MAPPIQLGVFEARQQEKQLSRLADARAVESGALSREELGLKNSFLSAARFDVDFESAIPLR
jgi:hypothetical protein